jgi:uncharacterized damage-inducible protein DinB
MKGGDVIRNASSSMRDLDLFIEHWTRYRAVTIQTLELMPDEHLHEPAPDERTLAGVFMHMAQIEKFYVDGLAGRGWDYSLMKNARGTESREEIRSTLEQMRDESLATVRTFDEAALTTTPEVPGIPVKWPLLGWLWYVLEHEIHHKAQLAARLRHLGVTPPFFAFPLPPGVRPDIRR